MNIQTYHSSSAGNLYKISDGKTPLLIEAGVPLSEIKRCLAFRLSEVAGALISHEHGDHAKCIDMLQYHGIDCYMSQGTAEALRVSGHRIHIIEAKRQFKIGTWQIMPFNVIHDAAEPLGFLLASGKEKLLYITDTLCVTPKPIPNLTHIMIEAGYDPNIMKENVRNGTVNSERAKRTIMNHMSINTVLHFLRHTDMSHVQEIHLLHLSNDNSHAERFKQAVQEATGRPTYVGEI